MNKPLKSTEIKKLKSQKAQAQETKTKKSYEAP